MFSVLRGSCQPPQPLYLSPPVKPCRNWVPGDREESASFLGLEDLSGLLTPVGGEAGGHRREPTPHPTPHMPKASHCQLLGL